MTLRVWAPDSSTVEALLGPHGELRLPMERQTGGWWALEIPPEAPRSDGEVDYAFSLDGGEALADPRSAWQPAGVAGPSRTFDVARHAWQDSGWAGPRDGRGIPGGVIYELHVGTFTPEGTLDAAIGRLDHLVALGVDAVELMPVAGVPGRWNWGYDGVALWAVHAQYGGPAALQRFVDACHARGLGVILDVVHNHLGPSGNRLGEFGPYFTDAHVTPWGPAVNLDQPGSAEVRAFVIGSVLRWFRDFHVDGLRLDAVHELRDDSERHVLAEMADAVAELSEELGRPLDLIAESDVNDPRTVMPTTFGGLGMSAQWADDVHHALHVVATGETQGYYGDFAGRNDTWSEGGSLSVLAKVLTEVFLHDDRWSSFRGARWGHPVDRSATSGHRFVAYAQTHDQVGNRATGDRIGHHGDTGRLAAVTALYVLSPFTPMVFMGEEWGASTPFQFFTDFDDPELAEAVRTGRRAEFASHGWAAEDVPDPQDPVTRDASTLRWEEIEQEPHRSLLAWHRVLIALRRSHPDAADGDLAATSCVFDEDAGWFVMRRGSVHVVCGFGEGRQEVDVAGVRHELTGWGERSVDAATGRVLIDGAGVAVVEVG